MKVFISAVVFAVAFSNLKATEFTEEEIRLFLPFIRRWVPPPCPMNELYKTCTGKCSDCTQRGRCIVTKCEEGCDCAPRFFRVTPDGPCEPVANCPKPECGENEDFRECGPICETCTLLECHVISCDHKCYCKEGYLRNKEGMCIPKEECPTRTRCSRTEEWAESGPVDEFCISGKDEDVRNKTQEVPGCYCTEGYKRNLLGRCVNETTCPMVRCFGDEVYHECIPKCNTTCRNYGDTNCTEDDNCYPGCFCPPGYVMNDFRSCIKVENCSLDIDQVKILDSVPEDDSDATTLPPTCPATDETTFSDDSTSTVDAAEFDTEEDTKADDSTSADDAAGFYTGEATKSEETTPVPKSDQVFTSASPTIVTSVSGSTAKEKTKKKDKIIWNKETKHENIAKEKEATKYELEEDEYGFLNDDF